MLAPFTRSPDRAAAASRVKHWTRERFRLGGDATILVTETDVPPAWYREALAVTPGVDCGCC